MMKSPKWTFTIAMLTACFLPVLPAAGQQMSSPGEPVVVPRLIRFSGKAVDAQGQVLSGIAGITFTIYKQQENGAPIWMETQNVSIDAGGNYSVLLGSTTANGLPADLFSQQEERWLAVQVQGQDEQPRVLLVSVPYAFKAYEADKLAGHSASEFVTADNLQTVVQQQLQQQGAGVFSGSTPGSGPAVATTKRPLVPTDGATDFVDNNANQVVLVTQNGSGRAILANSHGYTLDAVSNASSGGAGAIRGYASAPSGFGVFGGATSTTGVNYGVWGRSVSTSGIGVRALATATSGSTTGINATVTSASGTAGVFNNTAGGKILSGQNNGVERFAVDGSGNITTNGVVNAASGVTASSGGDGVYGMGNIGVWGQSTGSSGNSDGVHGVTSSAGASGVAGVNQSGSDGGVGVYGTGGIGVFGTGSAFGMQTDSNVQQARSASGWVKAMALVTGNGIAFCFNSTLAGAAATTPPCNFGFHSFGAGDYEVDFGFEVDDRFFSATSTEAKESTSACTSYIGGCNNQLTANQVEVTNFCDSCLGGPLYIDGKIYLIVY